VLHKQIGEGAFLKLLEEQDAPAVFEVMDRERTYLREWLPGWIPQPRLSIRATLSGQRWNSSRPTKALPPALVQTQADGEIG
jgi:hypothetical protein